MTLWVRIERRDLPPSASSQPKKLLSQVGEVGCEVCNATWVKVRKIVGFSVVQPEKERLPGRPQGRGGRSACSDPNHFQSRRTAQSRLQQRAGADFPRRVRRRGGTIEVAAPSKQRDPKAVPRRRVRCFGSDRVQRSLDQRRRVRLV